MGSVPSAATQAKRSSEPSSDTRNSKAAWLRGQARLRPRPKREASVLGGSASGEVGTAGHVG